MKTKIFIAAVVAAILCFLFGSFVSFGASPGFTRSNTNLPAANYTKSDSVVLVDRGYGLPPANVPVSSLLTSTRGLNDRATLGPDLTVEWYYTSWYVMPYGFMTNVGLSYYTNVVPYCSNMFREFKTNGYYAAGWRNFNFDDFWMAETNDVNGKITWNPDVFENGPSGWSLPRLISHAHDMGWKMHVYFSLTTNACGPKGSPIDRVYSDVQTAMSWGADGAKFDHCGPLTTETNTYYSDYFREVNRAIADYYSIVGATNGECRPFKVIATGSAGEEWPNSLTLDMLYGGNTFQIQPGIIHYDVVSVGPWGYAGVTNGLNMLRDVLRFRPYFRPGNVVYHGIGVYGNTPTCYWTNMLATAVLGCQPVEVGIGSRSGLFTAADQWKTDFFPLYSQFLTNTEVFEMHADPLVMPAVRTLTNSQLEVWSRPLANGDVALGISNLGITNKTSFTLNYWDMDLKPGVGYVVRDVWGKQDVATFTNTLTWSQGAESISLLRIRKNNYYTTAVQTNNVRMLWPVKSLTISSGLSVASYSSYYTPHVMVEGLSQSAANAVGEFSIPVPSWANSVEFVAEYACSAANTVAWTNRPYLRYTTPAGYVSLDADFDPVLYPEHLVICAPGTKTRTTNTFTFPATNTTKYISLQWKALTNGAAVSRHMIGAPELRFY